MSKLTYNGKSLRGSGGILYYSPISTEITLPFTKLYGGDGEFDIYNQPTAWVVTQAQSSSGQTGYIFFTDAVNFPLFEYNGAMQVKLNITSYTLFGGDNPNFRIRFGEEAWGDAVEITGTGEYIINVPNDNYTPGLTFEIVNKAIVGSTYASDYAITVGSIKAYEV